MPENSTDTWTITFDYSCDSPTRARYIGLDIARRLADVVPGFDANTVALARDTDPAAPLLCDRDIYCHRFRDHDGPCRDHNGRPLGA